ncbi:MAG: hypothetical protein FJZ08_00970 [Candidatus Omnitrophica bacterium]|nr:hypothetical protein [Candidatus Omnitrophota bacterium]
MGVLIKFKKLSVVALILANLFPLFGVLVLGWRLFPIMFLYWSESAIVGFFNILKIIKAQGTTPGNFTINDQPASKLDKCSIILFFIMHYGIFMTVHGGFIFALFGPADMRFWELAGALLFLFVSHGLSYIYNFLKEGEYKVFSPSQLLMQPYARIFIMHFTILCGAFVIKSLRAPLGALVIMVAVKTAIDLAAHIKQHNLENRDGSGLR